MRLIESSGAVLVQIAPGVSRVQGFFPDSVVALQTDRHGGVSEGPFENFNLGDHVGDDPQAVAANRKRLVQLCSRLGASQQGEGDFWINQVHGTRVITGLLSNKGSTADARVASNAGEICAVMTADCLPILIARPTTGQIAAAHAGWRGLCEGVIEATLDAMLRAAPQAIGSKQRDSSADEWLFWLGPAIGRQSFEVGEEVRQAFMRHDPVAAGAFRPSHAESLTQPDKWLADLGLLARQRIQAWPGDFIARIAQEDDCVMKNAAQYFSFRRCNKIGQPTGRMASLIFRHAT